MIFLRLAAIDLFRNVCAAKRLLAERLFYRRRASLSFYTAKALSGHSERASECPLSAKADVTAKLHFGSF